ncbi:hypothetical protein AB1N83_007283 [Pleurotus pulmonarius]
MLLQWISFRSFSIHFWRVFMESTGCLFKYMLRHNYIHNIDFPRYQTTDIAFLIIKIRSPPPPPRFTLIQSGFHQFYSNLVRPIHLIGLVLWRKCFVGLLLGGVCVISQPSIYPYRSGFAPGVILGLSHAQHIGGVGWILVKGRLRRLVSVSLVPVMPCASSSIASSNLCIAVASNGGGRLMTQIILDPITPISLPFVDIRKEAPRSRILQVCTDVKSAVEMHAGKGSIWVSLHSTEIDQEIRKAEVEFTDALKAFNIVAQLEFVDQMAELAEARKDDRALLEAIRESQKKHLEVKKLLAEIAKDIKFLSQHQNKHGLEVPLPLPTLLTTGVLNDKEQSKEAL